jgi:hypothetical protein
VQKIETIFEHGHHHSIQKEIKKHADKFTISTIGSPARKRDVYFINKENESMLNHLNNQTSPYNHKKYIRDR